MKWKPSFRTDAYIWFRHPCECPNCGGAREIDILVDPFSIFYKCETCVLREIAIADNPQCIMIDDYFLIGLTYYKRGLKAYFNPKH